MLYTSLINGGQGILFVLLYCHVSHHVISFYLLVILMDANVDRSDVEDKVLPSIYFILR